MCKFADVNNSRLDSGKFRLKSTKVPKMGTVRMFVIVRQPMIFKNSARLSRSHAVVYISSAPPPPFSCDFPGIFEGGTDELGRRGGSFDGIDGKCQKGAPSDGSDGTAGQYSIYSPEKDTGVGVDERSTPVAGTSTAPVPSATRRQRAVAQTPDEIRASFQPSPAATALWASFEQTRRSVQTSQTPRTPQNSFPSSGSNQC
ncbi:hypothetical protein DFH08DRAFT_814788 [Mycena albidolilacea]|uniref:Uncharacterized protein n=1 Tax=Mycena albidolilacea TaxID=1033008 RepID=A0AAD7EL82_9AGAR|nr:hypothetical protein DFH08DRAFT_814788 [Mycena albidolilacea]